MRTLARPGDKAEILRRLQDLRPDSVRRWGRMSAHQMVCHLSDACRVATGEMRVSDAAGRVPRRLVKWFALYLPMPWPPGILTRPEIDQETGGTKPKTFGEDVSELEALLDRLTQPSAIASGQVHPIFGRMSQAAWLRWAYLHADHHLRQFGH